MSRISELVQLCKCGVYLRINAHRDHYNTLDSYLGGLDGSECQPDLSAQQRADIIASDTLVEVQVYPDTPIGSYTFYGNDVDTVLEEAVTFLLERGE